jgi:SAM-dependent methyltransferase
MRHVRGPHVLDLGYIDGTWTDAVLAAGHRVQVVEGAARHIEHARAHYAGRGDVEITHALFEEFEPTGTYDSVIAGDMLGCLDDPVGFLASAARWLAPDGVLIATVPNSRSFHRRVGALKNIEATPATLNELYTAVGNRWSYDRYLLRHHFNAAGLDVLALRGCFLKPLPSDQIKHWDDALLRAFLDIGDELEDYAYYIYAVGRNRAG